ncbi:glycosyltransferase [Sporomusa termitida]|uniref:Rhamnosyltran: rhamnosyltransferase n=1 Tax=Sporomusa termitida TaxID=2377 RepID=A0A517DZW4_9FIRM|nr:glycosyltransferase [Sporomusa termitida]QDR82796.1 rhamnosyltran: rhamnosyltransferase [Sporomusa termitida]
MNSLGESGPVNVNNEAGKNEIIQPLTSIVILTYNKLDYNKLCIESIRDYTEPGSYEIIVIDNHSTDGTVEWLQAQPDLKLIANNENIGFPAGCNQGIKAACGDSVLLLNNDTIVTPYWLVNLRRCLFSAEDIGAVGAVTNSCSNFQSTPCEYSSIAEMLDFARQRNNSNPDLWEPRTRLVGYCMLIKTEIINKIGLLEEAFSPGNYEDDDYCLRIRNAGYRLILCWDTFIHHFGSISFGEQAIQYNSLLETNKQKFIEKWGLPPHAVAPYEPPQDVMIKKWFTYEHEVSFYKQWIENAKRKFYALIERAEFSVLTGNLENAVSLVKQAADAAHHLHPGFFSSPRAELVLRKVAQKLKDSVIAPIIAFPPRTTEKRNVLHVLSQGYHSGGHTRLVERWITMDQTAVHSVVGTLNSATNPPWLIEAAMQSGGWYNALDTTNLNLCQRAKMLRDIAAAWADLVVLHIHPHDPIAPIAFGDDGGPPVLFLNHADHAFTIGMSIADLVVELRAAGQLLSMTRRNSPASVMLPIPLKLPPALQDKQLAKQTLGISSDKIVFLTIATPYKLVPCGDYNFISLLREIIRLHENVEVLVIGPADAGEWAGLKRESNGRIRAFGIQHDLNLFHSAADIYLVSMPMGSMTAVLEAGVLGIPAVGLAVNVATLSADVMPGTVETLFTSYSDLFAAIDRLISDADFRSHQGNYLKNTILEKHYLGWPAHLSTLYSCLPASHKPGKMLEEQEQPVTSSDVIWAYFQHRSGLCYSSFG